MATIEQRGDALRLNWRLGGGRGGARQSLTFRGTPKGRDALCRSAKDLVEARSHNITREECRRIIFGTEPVDHQMPLFKDWVEAWLDGRHERREIQSDVITSYRTILRSRAVPYLGHLRLTEIDQMVLKNWLGWLSSSRITIGSKNRREGKRLLSSTTVRRTYSILHACLAGAVPQWLEQNPAARPAGASKHAVGLPKRTDFEGMFLTPAEIQTIFEHTDPYIRDMVLIAVHSGLRLGEMVALECRNVVFSQEGAATILVRKALKNDGEVGTPKSKAGRRDVTLNREASATIRRAVDGKRPSDLVFPSPRGSMWDENNFRDRYWYRSLAAASRCPEHPPPAPVKPKRGPVRALRNDEISTCLCPGVLRRRPRPHDLRHTHASLLIADGWHLTKIQKRLGHADVQTTSRVYAHLLDLGNAEELESFGELLRPRVVADVIRYPAPGGSVPRRGRRAGVRRRLVRR